LLKLLSGIPVENQVDSASCPFAVPPGWSVEWDPSPASIDPSE
jgi:hypothetical protein